MDRPVTHAAERGPGVDRLTVAQVALACLGLAMVSVPGAVVDLVIRLTPESFTAAGKGTPIDGWADVGRTVVLRLGVALLIAVAVSVGLRIRPWSQRPWSWDRRLHRVLRSCCIFAIPFVVFLYLSTPHNSFSSNSRFHWVDYLTGSSDVFFYAGGRLPHFLFYDHPPLWHAINAGLLALTVDAVLRRLRFGRTASALLALAFFSSAMVMLFADTGEDVLWNFLLLGLLLLSLTGERSWLRGAALAGVVLGRPEFLSMLGAYAAFAAMELVVQRRSGEWDRTTARATVWRHGQVYLWAALFITLCQIVFTIFGQRYLFTGGRIVNLGPLEDATPVDVDGFTISTFSGAYIGHFLWMLPVGFTAAIAAHLPQLVLRRPRPDSLLALRHQVVAFCIAAIAVTLLLHEAKPLLYFNVRYLSYTYPFVFIGGALSLEGLRRWAPRFGPLLWAFALLSLLALPAHPLAARDRRMARPEVQLYPSVDELRAARDGGTVIVLFGNASTRNAMAYVFRTDVSNIVSVEPDGLDAALRDDDQTLAVVKLEQLPSLDGLGEVVLTTDDLAVVRLAP